MDVSRVLWNSLISYPRFPYHVPPAHVLVRFRSCLTCSLLLDTCTIMDCRLVTGYLFVSRFPFCIGDSCAYISRLCLSRFVLSTRLRSYKYRLCLSFCSLSTRLSSRYSWTLTSHRVISLSCIFVLVSRILSIYTGWRWDYSPSSIYFATTLKVRPARSHVLSLVSSSSLAKATALRS